MCFPQGLSLLQFVRVCERIKWDGTVFYKDVNRLSKFQMLLQLGLLEQDWWHIFVTLITLVHVGLLGLIGTVPESNNM